MNDGTRKLMQWGSLAATALAVLLGATIIITIFSGHYLDLALPVVNKIYGTQESVPIAYDRGLRLCFLCAAVVMVGTAGIIFSRKK